MIKTLKRGEFWGTVEGKRCDADLVLTETLYQAGHKVPQHAHELAYFCLLLAGEYRETYNTGVFEYEPVSTVFHPPGETHRGEIGRRGVRCFNIEYRRRFLDRLHDYAKVPAGVVDLNGGELNWLGLRLYREFSQQDSCSPLAIEGLGLEMLAQVAREGPREGRYPTWLGEVTDLLHAEFRRTLTVNRIAERIGIHPVHLSRVYRKFHRRSIGATVRQLRVRRACEKLVDSELGLADVAYDAGFADQSQFSRAFKRVTGTTPGRFRASVRR